jgi:CheY-like chemotaxis protein
MFIDLGTRMTQTHESMSNPRATILIVDDDPDLLKLCAVKLQAQGFGVLTALGSTEAHRLCADHPGKIELIVIDVMLYPPEVEIDSHHNPLPRVHGDKLLPLLRTQRPLTRLMLMSASPPFKLRERGMAKLLSQYVFLQKPFTGEVLVEKVREALTANQSGTKR